MFMSNAAPAQPDTQPTRSGRLLALVRKLIDYGKELAATVRQRVASDPVFARASFGTADLAVIFARIARGLRLALALEERVLRRAAALDKEPRPRGARSAPEPRPPASAPAKAAEPPLADLPTAEQIAAQVRRRPIGAVIADIYRDLGILPGHPLWHEARSAIIKFGGSLARLARDILDRSCPLKPPVQAPATQAALPGPGPRSAARSGTGPPCEP